MKKAIVIGLDGFEPKIVSSMLDSGELPNLSRLRDQGGYSHVRTTYPAQTPVAWSSFATGTNPGGHGVFDFVARNPRTYLPDLALNRYERRNALLPPKLVNLRGGTPVWQLLSDAGIPSVILRCPCTYPPDNTRGKMLAGMGVPDVRGGLGTSTFYSSNESVESRESENIIHVQSHSNRTIETWLLGPRNTKTQSDCKFEITLQLQPSAKRVVLRSKGHPKELEIQERQWSDWLRVKFKTGPLQSVCGIVRFYLVRMEPVFELYASPINYDPNTIPLYPISSPPEYARDLAKEIGTFYTTGMVEDHTGLNNGRLDEAAYLQQCEIVLHEREKMMLYELDRFDVGLFFCLFDTPDRFQHMFWRFRENGHPANHGKANETMRRIIEDCYRRCDAIVGKALDYVDDQTLFIVLSDHGFSSFQRGVHLNTWLYDNGFLGLHDGAKPGDESGDFFPNVDWSRTKAYALGLSGIYLNLKGREEKGVVNPQDVEAVKEAIMKGLTGLGDPERGEVAIRSVVTREEIYTGFYAAESPDLLVNFSPGYRVSWATGLGGMPAGQFEDNVKKWSGDHIIDPSLVPGVLFMNRPFRGSKDDQSVQTSPSLVDLAPTILAALDVPKGQAMEGESLLHDASAPTENKSRTIIDENNETRSRRTGSEDEEKLIRERLSGLGYL
ncbi:phosphodiesterase [candidate division KSB1 bacterium]|nr:phosphodiesterase [candidate division KSB1 bacterium]NIV70982.1 phosphodiesterase [Phycisphaerae bacterium]NIR73112.1 phosphodiesterase [candidate division KSB1 bacterium]NIT75206.1 phosphodiesterase [candidate division KSB1 bacterium]NIU29045.1 phosphodiesterase [candidate division KSB1 bacterium]